MDTSITVTASTASKKVEAPVAPSIHITPTVVEIPEQRLQLFHAQEQNIQRFYQQLANPATAHSSSFYINQKKYGFIETYKLQMAQCLNSRDIAELDHIQTLMQNLYVVDDLVMALVDNMPDQRPVGWQLTSLGQNLLNLPTVGQLRHLQDRRGLEQSVAATVLQFFGVASFTLDKGYFIGHVLGYLFCCYYFSHLGVSYGVTPLTEKIALDYAYQWVTVPQLVRLIQTLDESLKAQVYQLAVYCAQISDYAIDKRIEKMLIAEVNSFNKNTYKDALNEQMTYSSPVAVDLFSALKPFK